MAKESVLSAATMVVMALSLLHIAYVRTVEKTEGL